jgi:DNA invertase Pin-like site-specific DNA recombinase
VNNSTTCGKRCQEAVAETRVGYARVSTLDQHPELQIDALEAAGCAPVYVDYATGSRADRPELRKALARVRPGGEFTVWKLDRLGRSMRHLLDTVAGFHASGITFSSLRDTFDTSTAAGRFQLHILAAVAEFERDLIRERTLEGLAAARARGRLTGRRSVMTPERVRTMAELLAAGRSVTAVAEVLGVSRGTVYNHLPR